MPRKKKDPSPKNSRNNMICNWCSRQFRSRCNLSRHLKKCTSELSVPWSSPFKCEICNIMYANKMLLDTHKQKVHDISKETSNREQAQHKLNGPRTKICNGCKKTCSNITRLWLHIRKDHYNLKANLPYCEQKKVNQVWFEKVLNCNNLMEIHKTAPNRLVMRKLDENTAIKVIENHTESIDLTHMYPTDKMKSKRISNNKIG